jgi:hypothetical protein
MSPPWARDRDDAEDRDPAGDDASGADPPSAPGAGPWPGPGPEAEAEAGWDDEDDDVDDEAALDALADLLLVEDLLFDPVDEVDEVDEVEDPLPAEPTDPTDPAPPSGPAEASGPYDLAPPADPGARTPPGAPADPDHGGRARRFRRLGSGVRAGWGPTGSPSGLAPEARRAARHAHRPVHRRRSRHSFEPDDLTDVELDRLLRGPGVPRGLVGSVGLDEAGRQADAGLAPRPVLAHGRSWPGWVTAVALAVLIVAALGLLRAAGGDTADTITTRGQSRPAPGPVVPAPTPSLAPSPAPSAAPTPSPTTAAPTVLPPTAPATVAPTPAQGAGELPRRADDAAAACHPSYDPCVPVADDVDCSGGEGNGPAYTDETVEVTGDDVYGLDADHDGQGCE